MPRKKAPTPPPANPNIDEAAVASAHQASRELAALDGEAAALAMRHMEMAEQKGALRFAQRLVDTMNAGVVRAFMSIRNDGSYKGYPYYDEKGVLCSTSTLEEFCPVYFGRSYDTMREREKQLALLGDSAFNSAVGMLTFKQLRAAEQAEDVDAVRAALEKGAKSEVLEIIEQQVELRKKAEEFAAAKAADYEALQKRHKVKSDAFEKVQSELHHRFTEPWHATLNGLREEMDEVFRMASAVCARIAELSRQITDVEIPGMTESAADRARRVIANEFYDKHQAFLHQGIARTTFARDEGLIHLVESERYVLSEEEAKKYFGEPAEHGTGDRA